MPHGCKFNELWLKDPKFSGWLKKNEKDLGTATCTKCNSNFKIDSMGVQALKKHADGDKHKLKMGSKPKISLNNFFSKSPSQPSASKASVSQPPPAPFISSSSDLPSTSTSSQIFSNEAMPPTLFEEASSSPAPVIASTSSELFNGTSSNAVQTTLLPTITPTQTLTAEIWLCLRTAMKNHSFSSNSDISFYLNKMFPGIPLVESVQCAETKTMYLTVFGIASHLKSILVKDIKDEPYSLLFDESLNKSLTTKQLDLHVRFWKDSQVQTRYLDSVMLGHATADILFKQMSSFRKDLNFTNIIQLSMDGPNVNWALYDQFTQFLKDDYTTKTINIGSCGLHQIHNAYRAAVGATSWEIEHFLTSLYTLFKNVPARREDFTAATNSSVFPQKFVPHRWVENQPVFERSLNMLTQIKMYVTAVQKKQVNHPKNKVFETVSAHIEDKLLPAKLSFLLYVCKPLGYFLTKFQSDAPLTPFLYQGLTDLLTTLLKKFVVPGKEGTVTKKEHLAKDGVCLTYPKIDIGMVTKEYIKDCSQKEVTDFRCACLKFYKALVSKLLDKSPLNYDATKYLRCLNPNFMVNRKVKALDMFEKLIYLLKDLGIVPVAAMDDLKNQFSNLLDFVSNKDEFRLFDMNKKDHRVDELFEKICPGRFQKIWPVIKKLLVLSHGQASVEKVFFGKQELQ